MDNALKLLFAIAVSATAGSAPISEDFDALAPGGLPANWTCSSSGHQRWSVDADPSAPSAPRVLAQSGEGEFPWCVIAGTAFAKGFVETQLKPISGVEDQAGGVVWRWKDEKNYYIARANAMEDNVAVFVMQDGRRHLLKTVALHVAALAWHSLRVEYDGPHFSVAFDGKRVLEADDTQLAGAGAVGVWTKGDSVTSFDNFRAGPR